MVTKIELQQANTKLAADNTELRRQLSEQSTLLAALRTQIGERDTAVVREYPKIDGAGRRFRMGMANGRPCRIYPPRAA